MEIMFEYLYRDAGNFKKWGGVVFRNDQRLDLQSLDAQIRSLLIDEEYFIAEKVGLPVLYFDNHYEHLDHGWHEFGGVKEMSVGVPNIVREDITVLVQRLACGGVNSTKC